MKQPHSDFTMSNSPNLIQSIVASAADLIFCLDDRGIIVESYPEAVAEELGLASQWVGKSLSEVLPATVQSQCQEAIARSHNNRTKLTYQIVRDSQIQQYQAILSRLDTKHTLVLINHIATTREPNFNTLVNNSPDPICRFDRHLNCLYANPAFCQQLNIPPAAILGKPYDQLNLPPNLASWWRINLQAAFTVKQSRKIELEWPGVAGKKNYQFHFIPETDDTQQIQFVSIVSHDITRQKQIITALKDSEEKFRAIFEQAAIGVAKMDSEGRFLEANQRYCNLLGYSLEELQQRTCNDLTHPEDRPINHECNLKIFQGKTNNYSLEKRYLRKDGQTCWVKLTVAAVRDRHKNCLYFIAAIEDIGDRKAIEDLLYRQERQFRALAENLPDIVVRYNRECRCVYINPAIEVATGLSRQHFIGKHIKETTSTPQKGIEWQNHLQHTFETQEQQIIDLSYVTPQGLKYYQAKLTPEINAVGEVEFVLMVSRDVTEQQQALTALQESEQKFRRIFEQAAIGLNRADLSGNYIQVNQKFCELLGYSEAELLQLTYRDITHPEDMNINLHWMDKLYSGEINHFTKEKRLICKNGEVKWVNLTVSLVYNAEGQPLYDIGIIQDVSDRKATEAQLVEHSLYDPITQLPNRTLFKDRLKVLLEQVRQRRKPRFAVLSLDIDRFKLINDSLGHSSGDEILLTVGQLLTSSLQTEDTIARFGGDEFMVMLPEIHSLPDAVIVAERLQNTLNTPFYIQGQEIRVTASIGIAMSHHTVTGQPYNNHMDLLRDADMAMYRAKRNGRACHYVFQGELHQEARSQLELESELRQALRSSQLDTEGDRQLHLHYQPLVDLQTNQLLGFEALTRWYHPSKGLISPGRFIPAAEESHLIVELGEWVLYEACLQLQAWQPYIETLHPDFTLSVNLAGRQLGQSHLTRKISRIIAETTINPHNLCLEITEVAIMENITSVLQKLEKLKSIGLKLSIDDFGTGYSSLARLQSFPIDTLKVDRSFVTNIHLNADSREIVRTILNLASGLKLNALAEGIELPEQQDLLRELGCPQGQGYLFAKPMTAMMATQLLTGQSQPEFIAIPTAS
ncbi:MAG: PAS domain S-box protein [Jaaginema sp. PMC 1079.18]|nr:PAS domain S-box protein [Jaaginema sp. PMC 1080.18]MEC4850949.1 PAS domain S-box protein [Jaaginema sp. PMC 1079.18]MEC4867069.1 PAS domain S-box protein [Jaaginema sp. PMC 1078.18]